MPPISEPVVLSTAWKRRLRRRLLAWYARHQRNLPWRDDRDPYRVWVSEIMLQQTQVATVVGYFHRFLTAFPTIADLARADEQEVLRLWEGLGYYRRARQLHAAAQKIVAEHDGCFPDDPVQVGELPGIGRYTAGAVLSIAFGQRRPILEANTLRLLSRLIALSGNPRSAAGQNRLWETAESILPRKYVGEFNQALMELGSQVCTSRSPQCETCPLKSCCAARAAGLEHLIPPPPNRSQTESVREIAVAVHRKQRLLLIQRAEGERWAGLWDFPRFSVEGEEGADVRRDLARQIQAMAGVQAIVGERLATMQHGVTRYKITLDCYLAAWEAGRSRQRRESTIRWFTCRDVNDLPMNTTGRKLSRLVMAAIAGC